ncbi:MAG: hypothetical protein C0168_01910 [Candidatus Aminicenantes bacterium]|nr:MAG: hypothetical protein C0168_01910 [Candidatus Aminicenantes bacterium]
MPEVSLFKFNQSYLPKNIFAGDKSANNISERMKFQSNGDEIILKLLTEKLIYWAINNINK